MPLIAIEGSLQPALRPLRQIARTNIASDDRAPTEDGTTDPFGLRHSSTEAGAVAAFEAAVQGLAAHKPSTGADLTRARTRAAADGPASEGRPRAAARRP
jgi:hypothetical protein